MRRGALAGSRTGFSGPASVVRCIKAISRLREELRWCDLHAHSSTHANLAHILRRRLDPDPVSLYGRDSSSPRVPKQE
ncbi:unnamed protein product [Peniophora sp. CBMAI 1063]|nr:unnamed protein product [Peniophora sp. CBMAI 1063]